MESPVKKPSANNQGNMNALIDMSSTMDDSTKKENVLKEERTPLKVMRNLNTSIDDSSISRGGGIASKIGLAMSRIVSSG